MSARARLALGCVALVLAAAPPCVSGAPLAITPAEGVRVQSFGIYDTARDTVVAVTTPATFTAPATIPSGARLLGAVAVPDHVWTADVTATAAPVRFRVVFGSEGAADVTLYERTIDIAARAEDRRWFDFGRDLGALAGRTGALRFETAVAAAPPSPGGNATSARNAAATTLALWAPPEIATDCTGTQPSLLLITIDALRADHLGSFGYARATSPYLDRFAAEGTRFASAFTAAPKTIPSIPQILTGRHFFRHRGSRGLETLLGGFERSRAIVNNPYVASWLGGERPGFATLVAGDLDARAITSAALRWLTAAGRCRTALYLHYLDTHTPYHAPPRYARRFIDPTASTTIGLTFGDVAGAWRNAYGGADRQRIIDLYDGSIAWTDRQLGRLFRALTQRHIAAQTLVIVTADHGEELWDHGHFFHGQSLYDELLHVPLLLHVPGGPPGHVIDDLVSSVDVVPTIRDVMSGDDATPARVAGAGATPTRDAAAAGDGASLRPLARGLEHAAPHPFVLATVSNAEPRYPPRQSVRSPTMKVIHDVADGTIEVYDLPHDPREQRNLGPAAPGAAELVTVLAAFRHRLEDRGLQLRVQSRAERPVAYLVQLTTDPPAPIVEPDRIALERGDRIDVGEHSTSLTVRGTIDSGDDDRVRMDVLAGTGLMRVAITLDGAPAPAGTLRVGSTTRPVEHAFDLADPALNGAPADQIAAHASGDAPPVTVTIWRAGGDAATPPPIDPSARDRLRALGYLE